MRYSLFQKAMTEMEYNKWLEIRSEVRTELTALADKYNFPNKKSQTEITANGFLSISTSYDGKDTVKIKCEVLTDKKYNDDKSEKIIAAEFMLHQLYYNLNGLTYPKFAAKWTDSQKIKTDSELADLSFDRDVTELCWIKVKENIDEIFEKLNFTRKD